MSDSAVIVVPMPPTPEAPARRPRKPPIRGLVRRIDNLTYDVKQLTIDLIDPPEIAFVPGQSIRLNCPPYGNNPQPVQRNYSIASSPAQTRCIELIIRLVPGGICTTWIFNILQEGDEVTFTGPFGKFRMSDSTRPMVWIAGGSGMGPFWSMVRHMHQQHILRPCEFFFGAQGREDLFLVEELRQMERDLSAKVDSPWGIRLGEPGFRFMPALSGDAVDDAWSGERGLITDVVARNLPRDADIEVYLCGRAAMIDAALAMLKEKGIPDERIFLDRFSFAEP